MFSSGFTWSPDGDLICVRRGKAARHLSFDNDARVLAAVRTQSTCTNHLLAICTSGMMGSFYVSGGQALVRNFLFYASRGPKTVTTSLAINRSSMPISMALITIATLKVYILRPVVEARLDTVTKLSKVVVCQKRPIECM